MPLDTQVTTAGQTLNRVWRKEQGNLLKGFKASTEEYSLVKNLKEYKLNVSAREITTPIDLNKQGGTAMIPEGGWEAQASTRPPEEITLTWVNANQRYTVTLTTQQLDRRNRGAQIERQMKYQAMKAMEAMSRRVGETMYGYSNGVVAKTSTALAAVAVGTLQLIDAYGEGPIDNPQFLSQFFAVEDRIVLIRAGAIVANSFGVITAVSKTAGTINVTFAGAVTSQAGDSVVFANSIENATLDGTDYNRWPVGLLEVMKSPSVHGLAHDNWNPGYSDTAGGRFSGVKLKKARYGIANTGGGKADTLIWSQGVETDVFDNQLSARRFMNDAQLDMDGVVKTKEKQFTSMKVPPGHAFMYDSDSFRKFTLEPLPNEEGQVIPWEDGDKIQGRNAWAFSMNVSYAFVVTNRANFAYFSGLSEQ
jgi:hypothetical protein